MAGNGTNSHGTAKRILVIFPGALGDLICLAPTLSAIGRQHAPCELELMAREELAQFAVGRLGVPRAHSIDRREVSHLFRAAASDSKQARSFFGSFQRIYSFFNADDPDFRSAMVRAAREDAVSFHRFRPAGTGHVAEAYLREIGGDSMQTETRLRLLSSDIESAAHRLGGIADPGEFIVIFPGSGSATKNWPVESFMALARQLEEETSVLFVLGPVEAQIERQISGRHRVMQGLSLGEVAALAGQAMAFIGVDSGVSHLASAAGAAGVVLFGPTDPARWRPLGRVRVVQGNPISGIQPLEVIAALRRVRSEAMYPHE